MINIYKQAIQTTNILGEAIYGLQKKLEEKDQQLKEQAVRLAVYEKESSEYKHCINGETYKYLVTAVFEEEPSVLLAVYANSKTGKVWARRHDEFFGIHKSGLKRFKRISEEEK